MDKGLIVKRSKKSARQDRIIDALERNPAMRVSELASDLDVSAETVRRDLSEMDAEGRIKRTYGGAVRATTFEPDLNERLKLKVREREGIARQAVQMVGDAETIAIGGGATTWHFARALRAIDRRLTVLTATFSVAMELSTNPLIQVMSLPGIVEPKEGLVCGPETLKSIAKFRPPLAFLGASAVDGDGVSEALLSAADVYTAMAESADRRIVLADVTKFEKRSLQLILEWSPDTVLVTDEAPSAQLGERIERAGGEILIA